MSVNKYIPSPIEFDYDCLYSAITNKSGRMQYYKAARGKGRKRISRNEFTEAYNNSMIIAVSPIQEKDAMGNIQMDIYVKNNKAKRV